MWLLYQFQTSEGDIVTRGRTSAEAIHFLVAICGLKVLQEQPYCEITAAYQYSRTHQFDWLNSPPRWFDSAAPWLPIDPTFKDRFYPAKLKAA